MSVVNSGKSRVIRDNRSDPAGTVVCTYVYTYILTAREDLLNSFAEPRTMRWDEIIASSLTFASLLSAGNLSVLPLCGYIKFRSYCDIKAESMFSDAYSVRIIRNFLSLMGEKKGMRTIGV